MFSYDITEPFNKVTGSVTVVLSGDQVSLLEGEPEEMKLMEIVS